MKEIVSKYFRFMFSQEGNPEEEEEDNNGSSVVDVDKVTAEDGVVDSDEASNLPGNDYYGLEQLVFLVTKMAQLIFSTLKV